MREDGAFLVANLSEASHDSGVGWLDNKTAQQRCRSEFQDRQRRWHAE